MVLQFGEVVVIRCNFIRGRVLKSARAGLRDTGDDHFVAEPITSQLRHSDYDIGRSKRGSVSVCDLSDCS